jgi:hypothetical protein
MKLLIIAVPNSTREEQVSLIATQIAAITNASVKVNLFEATDFIPENVKPDETTAIVNQAVEDIMRIGGNHADTFKFSANLMKAIADGVIEKRVLQFLIENRIITQKILLEKHAAGVYQLITTGYNYVAKKK